MKKANRINDMLELPREVYSNEPKLVINGFNEMIIENYKGILEYEDYYIKINTFIGSININGYKLNLQKMTEDNIKITGQIESIDIEKTLENN